MIPGWRDACAFAMRMSERKGFRGFGRLKINIECGIVFGGQSIWSEGHLTNMIQLMCTHPQEE